MERSPHKPTPPPPQKKRRPRHRDGRQHAPAGPGRQEPRQNRLGGAPPPSLGRQPRTPPPAEEYDARTESVSVLGTWGGGKIVPFAMKKPWVNARVTGGAPRLCGGVPSHQWGEWGAPGAPHVR